MQIPSANVCSEEPRNLDTLASETCVNTIDKLTNRGWIGQILELRAKTIGAPRNTRRLAYIEVGICGFNEVLYFISNLLLCKLTYSIIRPGLQTNPQFIEPLKRLIEESSLTISIPRPPVCFEAICSNQVPVVANSGHNVIYQVQVSCWEDSPESENLLQPPQIGHVQPAQGWQSFCHWLGFTSGY